MISINYLFTLLYIRFAILHYILLLIWFWSKVQIQSDAFDSLKRLLPIPVSAILIRWQMIFYGKFVNNKLGEDLT